MGSCVRAALVACMLGVLCLAVQTSTTTARAPAPQVEHRALQSPGAEGGEALFRSGLGRAHVEEFEMPRVMYRLEAYLLH